VLIHSLDNPRSPSKLPQRAHTLDGEHHHWPQCAQKEGGEGAHLSMDLCGEQVPLPGGECAHSAASASGVLGSGEWLKRLH
jgi:hypothetical protein